MSRHAAQRAGYRRPPFWALVLNWLTLPLVLMSLLIVMPYSVVYHFQVCDPGHCRPVPATQCQRERGHGPGQPYRWQRFCG